MLWAGFGYHRRPPMARHADIPRVALQVSRSVVVASIQVDLDEDVLFQFRQDLLERIHQTGCHGAILDVSGLDMLDSDELASLRRIMDMTSLMGAESVLVGLQPGVVSALIEAGADVDGLQAAISLDAAFDLLEARRPEAAGAETEEPAEGEAVEAGFGVEAPQEEADR